MSLYYAMLNNSRMHLRQLVVHRAHNRPRFQPEHKILGTQPIRLPSKRHRKGTPEKRNKRHSPKHLGHSQRERTTRRKLRPLPPRENDNPSRRSNRGRLRSDRNHLRHHETSQSCIEPCPTNTSADPNSTKDLAFGTITTIAAPNLTRKAALSAAIKNLPRLAQPGNTPIQLLTATQIPDSEMNTIANEIRIHNEAGDSTSIGGPPVRLNLN